jgi:hypothetical protein
MRLSATKRLHLTESISHHFDNGRGTIPNSHGVQAENDIAVLAILDTVTGKLELAAAPVPRPPYASYTSMASYIHPL